MKAKKVFDYALRPYQWRLLGRFVNDTVPYHDRLRKIIQPLLPLALTQSGQLR